VSFDVYVQFFADGREAGIAASVVRDAFPGLVEVLDDDYWLLRFGVDTTTDLFLRPPASDPNAVHSLSFHRPAEDARLWQGIWELLATPGAVFHFPGASAPFVRLAASREAMPASLRGAMGEAVVAREVGELTHAAGVP
jgi:hypothetical protein